MIAIAKDAIEGEKWRFVTKEHCAVFALDLRNAFYSANFGRIVKAILNGMITLNTAR